MDDAMLATAAVGGVLGAAGALWNGVQIARLAGRVDALESTMQAVINALFRGHRRPEPWRPDPARLLLQARDAV